MSKLKYTTGGITVNSELTITDPTLNDSDFHKSVDVKELVENCITALKDITNKIIFYVNLSGNTEPLVAYADTDITYADWKLSSDYLGDDIILYTDNTYSTELDDSTILQDEISYYATEGDQ